MHYAWAIAITGTFVLMLAQGFGRLSYAVILPQMKASLSLTYTQVGLIGTANFVGYLSLAVLGGFLAVRFGPRRTIFLSLVVMGVGLLLTGLASSFEFALLTRLLAGIGNGGAVVPMMGLATMWFATGKRGLASGILGAGLGLGVSINGLVLPHLMSRYGPDGWRFAWYALGSVVLVVCIFCFGVIRDTPEEKNTSMYGGDEKGSPAARVTLFSAWRDVTRESEIWKLGLVYSMFGFSYIIYMTFFVAYLTNESGMEARKAGEIFALVGFVTIFSGILWGWLSDIFGRRLAFIMTYMSLAASYLIFAWSRGTAGFYVSAVVFGLALSSVPSIMGAAVGDAVGGRLAPAGLGLVTLMFGIAQCLGPAVAGWLKDATGTFVWAFILSAAVSLTGAAASLMLRKKSEPPS